jgi:hypothetical protein
MIHIKNTIALVLILLLLSCSFSRKKFKTTADFAPDHAIWDSLLKKHVNEAGMVDYIGLQSDSIQLNKYLKMLSDSAPNPKKWTEKEQLAYWINAYNAFTVQLVIRYYPIASIKDISSGLNIPFVSTTWDIKFIEIGGERLDLNRIEHGIIRKEFEEPRIHFAVNCASISCPKLRREAYTATHLEEQLEAQAIEFINDPMRNLIKNAKDAEISKLFTWFSGDFKKKSPDIRTYINRYSKIQLAEDATIRYMDYDWGINDQKVK